MSNRKDANFITGIMKNKEKFGFGLEIKTPKKSPKPLLQKIKQDLNLAFKKLRIQKTRRGKVLE